MFWLRLCLILWLSPSVIFRVRVVQGLFHSSPLGEAGEHQSLDSASWNSRDFHNIQQNVQTDEQTHNVHSAHPVNNDFLNQMHKEYIKWAENEISPLDEWYNPSDSAPNLEEVMNSYHRDPWDFALVKDSGIAIRNHQQKTYPFVGSSKDQEQSSSTIQPLHDEIFVDGDHVKLVSHFDEFRHSDSSFVPQSYQSFEIPQDEQMTQYPAFPTVKNDLFYSPHLSETRNRVYQSQDCKRSYLNPSSSHNSGFIDSSAAIDQRSNSKDNKNLIIGTPKKRSKNVQTLADAEGYIRAKKKLITILKENFIICAKERALGRVSIKSPENVLNYIESKHKKSTNFMKHNKPQEVPQAKYRIKGQSKDKNSERITRLKKYIIVEYAKRIEWTGSDVLKAAINSFADGFDNYQNAAKKPCTPGHIKNISVLGITFMKIIAKNYSNYPSSKVFGHDDSLLHYTKSFWNFCFTYDGKTDEDLEDFFANLGEKYTKKNLDQFLSTGFSHAHNTPKIIFSQIKTKITIRTDTQEIFLFSWYFVFFRAMVYYPQLIFKDGYLPGNKLKKFIEDGIMHFFETGKQFE
ncbi:expressed protein [Phakopsora pachyrhizi]|uniref:Expressed protein n=1 Tax=Phakopsora pachyrhizi TaxID=170000 RepID=A0AAV0B8U1_PHAPC|nr:expressed protein [Phakopsora pachyrhizi]